MPEPTVAELFRLDELLSTAGDPRRWLRFRRLWAAYATKFEWPFSDAPDGLYAEDAATAWRRWAGLEEKYSL